KLNVAQSRIQFGGIFAGLDRALQLLYCSLALAFEVQRHGLAQGRGAGRDLGGGRRDGVETQTRWFVLRYRGLGPEQRWRWFFLAKPSPFFVVPHLSIRSVSGLCYFAPLGNESCKLLAAPRSSRSFIKPKAPAFSRLSVQKSTGSPPT